MRLPATVAAIYTHTHRRSNELCVVEKFSMNLLYFFFACSYFVLFCLQHVVVVAGAFINNYFVVLATSRVFSLSAPPHTHTHSHSPPKRCKGVECGGAIEFSGLVV